MCDSVRSMKTTFGDSATVRDYRAYDPCHEGLQMLYFNQRQRACPICLRRCRNGDLRVPRYRLVHVERPDERQARPASSTNVGRRLVCRSVR